MKRIRFTIASLLVVVLFLAVGFAALRESSDLWDSGLFSLTLGVPLISVLLAIHSTESRRAFWLGFAVFGWIYLGLTLVPHVESRLITTRALTQLDSKVPGRSLKIARVLHSGSWILGSGSPGNQVQNVAFTIGGNRLAIARKGVVRLWDATTGKLLGGWTGTTANFVRIGHSLFALLVGWFGGHLSCRLCRTSRSSEPSTAVHVEETSS